MQQAQQAQHACSCSSGKYEQLLLRQTEAAAVDQYLVAVQPVVAGRRAGQVRQGGPPKQSQQAFELAAYQPPVSHQAYSTEVPTTPPARDSIVHVLRYFLKSSYTAVRGLCGLFAASVWEVLRNLDVICSVSA